jgi:hypothetical protein
MAEELCTLSERFVAKFVFRDAAEREPEPPQPELCHLSVHHGDVLVGINVVVAIARRPILLRTFRG